MSKSGYTYILKCSDDSYYTGSTIDLERRLQQHQIGEGANYTKARLPVLLVYYEEYEKIGDAFYREKQIQNWNRKKKQALMDGNLENLPELAKKVFRDGHLDSAFGHLDTISAKSLDDQE